MQTEKKREVGPFLTQQVSVIGAHAAWWDVCPDDVLQVTRLLASEERVGDDHNLELYSILNR